MKTPDLRRYRLTFLAALVLGVPGAGAAPTQSNINAAIAEANAMVKLGIPTQVIDAWLLKQIKGVGTVQTPDSAVAVQAPPPSWDVYARAAWKQQESDARGSDQLQRENDGTRTRLGLSSADQDPPHATPGQTFEISQAQPQATNALPAGTAAH